MELMPAGSKIHPLLAKAKPISDGNSTSRTTKIRRGRKPKWQIYLERRVRIHERNNSADSQGQCRSRGRRYTRHWSRDFPLQPVEKAMVKQAVPLQPTEVQGIHLQPVEETPRWSRWMSPHEALTLWRICAGAGSWQELWTCGKRSPCRSRFAGRARDPMGDPRWSSLFLKGFTLWEGPTLGQFMKNCSLWEGLTLEQFVEDPTLELRQSMRSPAFEEEEQQRQCDKLTITLIPCPPVLLGGDKVEKQE